METKDSSGWLAKNVLQEPFVQAMKDIAGKVGSTLSLVEAKMQSFEEQLESNLSELHDDLNALIGAEQVREMLAQLSQLERLERQRLLFSKQRLPAAADEMTVVTACPNRIRSTPAQAYFRVSLEDCVLFEEGCICGKSLYVECDDCWHLYHEVRHTSSDAKQEHKVDCALLDYRWTMDYEHEYPAYSDCLCGMEIALLDEGAFHEIGYGWTKE